MGRLALRLLTVFIGSILSGPVMAQAIGGSGSGGGGLRTLARSGVERIAARSPGCEEGRQSIFVDRNPRTNEEEQVVKTCRKGTYYDLSQYVYDPKPECKREGDRYIKERRNKYGRKYHTLGYCREGKVIEVGEAPPHMVPGSGD